MRVVIIGAGHAGATLAMALRSGGFEGEVVVLGGEPHPPYQRPPLSKQLLQRDTPQPLQSTAAFADHGIDLRLATQVSRIDRSGHQVEVEGADPVDYDVLVLATGATPRRLPVPGADLSGVHVLRTLDDARALAERLGSDGRLAVIGAGWIGLEVAGSARAAGLDVVVLEREHRILARVGSADLASHVASIHEQQGVRVRTDVDVADIVGDGGSVTGVRLADGEVEPCTAVLVGVGAVPDTDLATEAGLAVEGGVLVDGEGRTSDPTIFAIGDVARPADGIRLESIPSAQEQARRTAAVLLGQPVPDPETPWFWSEQHEHHLQLAGIPTAGSVPIRRGAPGAVAFSVLHVDEGRVVAVEAVDLPSEFMAARSLIASGEVYDLADLADVDRRLRDLTPAVATATDPEVVFVMPDGSETSVRVPEGQAVMEAALIAEVPGIVAECGGLCTCGTCHVQVDEDWYTRLDDADDYEQETLEIAENVCPTSRLSCQLVMTCKLDGLRVHVPDSYL